MQSFEHFCSHAGLNWGGGVGIGGGVMLNVTRILFADIFFFIISLFGGGLFRGWLAKKE